MCVWVRSRRRAVFRGWEGAAVPGARFDRVVGRRSPAGCDEAGATGARGARVRTARCDAHLAAYTGPVRRRVRRLPRDGQRFASIPRADARQVDARQSPELRSGDGPCVVPRLLPARRRSALYGDGRRAPPRVPVGARRRRPRARRRLLPRGPHVLRPLLADAPDLRALLRHRARRHGAPPDARIHRRHALHFRLRLRLRHRR